MRVHKFQIHEIEYSAYHLGFNTNLFLDSDELLQVNDVVIIEELLWPSEEISDRKLVYKIIGIQKHAISNNEKSYNRIDLKRLKNYDSEMILFSVNSNNIV